MARFAALRSQELVHEISERVLRLEHYIEPEEEVREGGVNGVEEEIQDQGGAENGEQSQNESVVNSDVEDRSGAGVLAATVVWVLVVLFSATVLVRVGRQL